MGKQMMLKYSAEDNMPIFDVKDINSSFATGSIKVMYLGANRNGSSFSKEAVTAALPSIKNVPIVCHYDLDSGKIGGHDVAVVSDNDGNLRLRNLTSPIGVVPESATYSFETAEDSEGNTHDYLTISNVVLWKRQDAYEHIVNDLGGVVGHSMEVRIKDGSVNSVSGLYEVTNFEFTALCLLETATPCFQGSELEISDGTYALVQEQLDNFNSQMETMLAEWKETFAQINTEDTDVEDAQDHFAEGGEKMSEEKIALITEFGMNADELTFDVSKMEIDELREKLQELKASLADEPEVPEADDTAEEDETFELAKNVRESLERAVEGEKVERRWGEEPKYFMVEYDQDASMVYIVDDCGMLFGVPYSMNGDEPVLDMENKKRMKWAIVDYDGGEQQMPFAGMFERASEYIGAVENDKNDIAEKFEKASADIESMNMELSELREFKAGVDAANASAQRNKVFAQFEDLFGNEAFEALKENCSEYSVEDIEEKCFAIRGRMAQVAKFSYTEKTPKIKVVNESMNGEAYNPYGGVVEYYANKNN